MPIRLEQVSTSVGQDDRSVVGAEWGRAQQTLLFEVALSSAGVLAAIVEIALGHDAEGTDGGEYAALSTVDLIHAIPFSNWPPLAPAGQVEILREHMSRVVIIFETALTAAAAATAVSIAVATVAVISRPRIVSVPHASLFTRVQQVGIASSMRRGGARRNSRLCLFGCYRVMQVAASPDCPLG
jgi:hypothetical protein